MTLLSLLRMILDDYFYDLFFSSVLAAALFSTHDSTISFVEIEEIFYVLRWFMNETENFVLGSYTVHFSFFFVLCVCVCMRYMSP